MIGAIIGDIVGSIYEFDNHKNKAFDLFKQESTFTDDTVMSIAVADFALCNHGNPSQARFVSYLHKWYLKYPNKSYGDKFTQWIQGFSDIEFVNFNSNNSFGNGAAMKISPVGDSASSLDSALTNAKFITEVSHNHKEGIKGAQAVASLIFLARKEKRKAFLQEYIENDFDYDLTRTVSQLRKTYKYNETCQATVPEAIICFMESIDFEDAIRNAVSIGGDTDTLCAITGSIAEAYYQEIPEWILKETVKRLPKDILNVLRDFYNEVSVNYPKISKEVLKNV
ncbi:ADP-ribosylglycohydrolase family protein [Formosa algae]|uniref:ADP-ribosylglycohydrolase n=1 Tax=Formosa algae TaxID=225843 RepID=A0A9X0YKE0_9FLAO|nr:ADP-ribosylglycohydrolase family protein [Formosa algae]MBP1840397.1 ADP-ribosylglycohydrolase [Formosa algae]MDQ0336889.1 ADP-ribosylglycohydrolase [Formosa algae]OEI79537.1 hypothetical protein AST99_13880 [Formosa algae]